jgi:leader peptidase (prepilin peptidase)/N-methyltransferase
MIQVYIILGLLGLILGSFLNVVIYRLPRKLSLWGPRSMCPSCRTIIHFYDNIPVLSYLFLKGKCRHCGAVIHWRYPVVELLTALLLILIAMKYNGWQIDFVKYSILVLVLIPVTFIDLELKIIPNWLTFSGFILGAAITLLFQIENWKFMVLGMASGAAVPLLLMFLGKIIFKKEAMGMGDVKLFVMTGTYVGLKGVLAGLFMGSVVGLFILLIPMILKKIKFGDQVPFGPVIAIGTIIYVLVGTDLIAWYLKLLNG